VAAPLSLLAAAPFVARPSSHVVTTPSAVVRAPLGEETSCNSPYAAPFGAGEKLDYSVKFGFIKAGQGSVEVVGRDTIRGREVWHTRFRLRGGVPMYKVDDVLESWIDTDCFQSRRFVSQLEERGKTRERRIEMYPERLAFSENDKPEERSAPRPLDDGSFFFFVRTQDLVVGQTYEYGQYFRPDRNPVIIRVIGRERVKVPAGEFDAYVLKPIIKSKGLFGENGQAEVWFSADSARTLLRLKSKLPVGTLYLELKQAEYASRN
jgi:hypothetical protein